MSPKKVRTGSIKAIASGAKTPRADPQVSAGPADEDQVTVSFRYADKGYAGTWSWPEETSGHAHTLLDFLCDISRSTWREVRSQMAGSKHGSHRKHHEMDIATLCPDARDRIAHLHLDEVFGDEIFRFRLGNKLRLWGFIAAGVFYVLWWDAGHAVYPLDRD